MQMIDIEQLPGGAAAPLVRVGDASIDEAAIALEMQYHPAETAGEAQLKAARALVVRELLRQRADMLGLMPSPNLTEAQEGDCRLARTGAGRARTG